MEWQYVVTIVGSIVGATGLFKFIEFLISRRDNYSTRDSSVSREIEGIKSDIKSASGSDNTSELSADRITEILEPQTDTNRQNRLKEK